MAAAVRKIDVQGYRSNRDIRTFRAQEESKENGGTYFDLDDTIELDPYENQLPDVHNAI